MLQTLKRDTLRIPQKIAVPLSSKYDRTRGLSDHCVVRPFHCRTISLSEWLRLSDSLSPTENVMSDPTAFGGLTSGSELRERSVWKKIPNTTSTPSSVMRRRSMTTAQISERLVTYGNIKKTMALGRLGVLLSQNGYRSVHSAHPNKIYLLIPIVANSLFCFAHQCSALHSFGQKQKISLIF